MRFACMSCGAKYSVPDGRLEAAGPAGLRVRCSRCRAIMVVSDSQRALFGSSAADRGGSVESPGGAAIQISASELVAPAFRPAGFARANEDEDTKKEVRRAPMRRGSFAGGLGQEQVSSSDVVIPAALSASGVYRPMPGVNRDVTGLFFTDLETLKREGKPVASRVWYAAIGNRPRGPFSASEVISLAQKGKVRESTLVWRPGFASWKRVRDGDAGNSEDLSWLRNIVSARLRREREAEERARKRGIASLNLTRTSSGSSGSGSSASGSSASGGGSSVHGSSVHGSAVWSLPDMPPLPEDDDDGALAPSRPAEPQERLVPFQWRAVETAPRAVGVRRGQDTLLWAVALSAVVVVAAVIVVESWRNGVLPDAVELARGWLGSLNAN